MINSTCKVFLCVAVAGLLAVGCTPTQSRHYENPESVGFLPFTFARFDALLDDSTTRGLVPGAVLVVARDGQVVYHYASGIRDGAAEPDLPMTEDTRFDVASLTKPVATAAAAGALACEGSLSPGDVIGPATLDMLLRHTSGLPVYADWKQIEETRGDKSTAEAALELARKSKDTDDPGTVTRYSNIGYLLAGETIESRGGASLETIARERIWSPLGMGATSFRPPSNNPIARTSRDVTPGKPFDPLADYVLTRSPDHEPGHSGLFTTANDLTKFAQALLRPEDTAGVPANWDCISHFLLDEPKSLPVRPVDGFAESREPETRTRAFLADETRLGRIYYHTGYTGSLIWLHPASGTSVVLLTNATHGKVENWNVLRKDILKVATEGIIFDQGE